MSEIVKVSSTSEVKKVAGSIASFMRENKEVEVRVIGAAALNQAVKAVIVARGFVAINGLDLTVVPGFDKAIVEGEERTSIKLFVKRV